MVLEWVEYSIDELKSKEKMAIAIGPFGSRMKSECYINYGVPVIRGNNLNETPYFSGDFVYISEEKAKELYSSIVVENDIVFPHRGNIGEVGIVPSNPKMYILSSSLMKLTVNTSLVEPLFLFYFFRSDVGRYELLKNSSQVGTPGIATPLASLKNIRLKVPPVKEQKKIVKLLKDLDDKIELNRKMNTTLEQIAQALFKSWFVDFDLVKAKAAGQQPQGMDAKTAALFPSEFEQSELGMIPKGWKAVPLTEIIEINPTRRLSKDQLGTYLDMANVATQGHRPIAWIKRVFNSGTKFKNGDTLLARITPCLENGKTAFVDFLPEGEIGWGSTEFIVLHPKSLLPEYFAYLLCREPKFRAFAIKSMAGTSGRQRVQTDLLGQYILVVASDSVYQEFDRITKPIIRKISQNDEEIKILSELRDSLLPKLISGQIRIPDIEQSVGDLL